MLENAHALTALGGGGALHEPKAANLHLHLAITAPPCPSSADVEPLGSMPPYHGASRSSTAAARPVRRSAVTIGRL